MSCCQARPQDPVRTVHVVETALDHLKATYNLQKPSETLEKVFEQTHDVTFEKQRHISTRHFSSTSSSCSSVDLFSFADCSSLLLSGTDSSMVAFAIISGEEMLALIMMTLDLFC